MLLELRPTAIDETLTLKPPPPLCGIFRSAQSMGVRICHIDVTGMDMRKADWYYAMLGSVTYEHGADGLERVFGKEDARRLLSISVSGCTSLGRRELCVMAACATNLVVADMSSVNLRVDAAEVATELVHNCIALEVLDMSSNRATARHMWEFFRMVSRSGSLKQLTMNDVEVAEETSDDHIRYFLQLKHSHLTHLSLSHTKISVLDLFRIVRNNFSLSDVRKDDLFTRTTCPEHPTVVNCAGLCDSDAIRHRHDQSNKDSLASFPSERLATAPPGAHDAFAANVQEESHGWIAFGGRTWGSEE